MVIKVLNIIDLYISNLRKEDIIMFAQKNDINLSEQELDFTYNFIKTNYKEAIKNKDNFNLNEYKEKFSEENFSKIEALLKKYINYL